MKKVLIVFGFLALAACGSSRGPVNSTPSANEPKTDTACPRADNLPCQ